MSVYFLFFVLSALLSGRVGQPLEVTMGATCSAKGDGGVKETAGSERRAAKSRGWGTFRWARSNTEKGGAEGELPVFLFSRKLKSLRLLPVYVQHLASQSAQQAQQLFLLLASFDVE